MTKIEEFVKLITGRFDNKEQFDAMKKAGKTYPYAQHVNTVCNDKIKNLPADFKGIFVGQFPVAEWHDRLGGGTQADSIMDRIVHNAYEIPSSETNLRKIYDSKKLANLKAEIEK